MKIVILQVIVIVIALFFNTNALAGEGVGQVAQNLMEPVTLFSQMISTACFLIGGSFVFASIIKYFEHKRSPLMTPISTVVFLLIAGLVLILLPFISMYTNPSGQYALMK